jgi:hypothetical protein
MTLGLILRPSRRYPPLAIMRCIVLLGLSLVGLVGCATYRDDLARGQHYYDLNQYDNALSIWRLLERDWDSLDPAEQSRYAYLRGMTDYRMGYRADSRHWLANAKAISDKHPGGLDASALAQTEKILTELNNAQYQMGMPTSPIAAGMELTNVAPTPAPPPEASALAVAPTEAAPPAAAASAEKSALPSDKPTEKSP